MRHRKAGVKLGRTSSHRDAMFRNMVTSLLKYDRIQTTDVKAKELRRWVDKVITLAKRGDLHARRQALAIVREKDVVHNLFEQVQERFGQSSGGYSRIVKIGQRPGDAAPMSLIELIPDDQKAKKDKKKPSKAVKSEAKPETVAAPAQEAITDTDSPVSESDQVVEATPETAASSETTELVPTDTSEDAEIEKKE